uniref:SAM domain-containing protein n=1 Tax=Rhabditophanes sp. KR3021 TaxID=114890 RepID=A0AC35TYG4_9BILA
MQLKEKKDIGSKAANFEKQGANNAYVITGPQRSQMIGEVNELKRNCYFLEQKKVELEERVKDFMHDIEEITMASHIGNEGFCNGANNYMVPSNLIEYNQYNRHDLPQTHHQSQLNVHFKHLPHAIGNGMHIPGPIDHKINPEPTISSNLPINGMSPQNLGKTADLKYFEIEQLRSAVQQLIVDNDKKNKEIMALRNVLSTHHNPSAEIFNARVKRMLIDDSKENIVHSSSYPVNLSNFQGQFHPSTSYTSNLCYQGNGQPSSRPWSTTSDSSSQLPPTGSLPKSNGFESPAFRNTPISPSNRQIAAKQLASELDQLKKSGSQRNFSYDGNSLPKISYSKSNYSMSLPRNCHYNVNSSLSGELLHDHLDIGDTLDKNGGWRQLPLPPPPRPLHRSRSVSSLSFLENVPNRYCVPVSGAVSSQNKYDYVKDQVKLPMLSKSASLRRSKSKARKLSVHTIKDVLFGDNSWMRKSKKDPEVASVGNSNARSVSVPNLVLTPPPDSKSNSEEDSDVSAKSKPPQGERYTKNGVEIFKDENSNLKITILNNSSNIDDESTRSKASIPSSSTSNFKRDRARSTFKNIFTKLKRSASQHIDSSSQTNRKNSSTKIYNSSPFPINLRKPVIQEFVDWNGEKVAEYFCDIGFCEYSQKMLKNIRSGRHLLNLNDHEIEKELGIKNSLHFKKLKYHLTVIETGVLDPADSLTTIEIMSWLDDIGLPQLKDTFQENKIDGPMLNNLTVQDLCDMKIVSAMKHASISRAIQQLRRVEFVVGKLDSTISDNVAKESCPKEVKRWSQAATCQWLRKIDLVEFTPNLLGRGIHGALLTYEPTFTAESLCEVLRIPKDKTLIRRHVISQFNLLLGQDIISHKRIILSQPNVTHLSIDLKVKVLKKRFLSLSKNSPREIHVDAGELVCPIRKYSSDNEEEDDELIINPYIKSLATSNV